MTVTGPGTDRDGDGRRDHHGDCQWPGHRRRDRDGHRAVTVTVMVNVAWTVATGPAVPAAAPAAVTTGSDPAAGRGVTATVTAPVGLVTRDCHGHGRRPDS